MSAVCVVKLTKIHSMDDYWSFSSLSDVTFTHLLGHAEYEGFVALD